MNPVRKQRLMIVIAVMVGVIVAGSLIFFAVKKNLNFFYMPSQAILDTTPINQTIKVGGMVKKGSVEETSLPETKELVVKFVIYDDKGQLPVQFAGVLPDLFAENATAIAIGQLNENREFIADEILAKHDEKYVPQEIMDSYKQHEGEQ